MEDVDDDRGSGTGLIWPQNWSGFMDCPLPYQTTLETLPFIVLGQKSPIKSDFHYNYVNTLPSPSGLWEKMTPQSVVLWIYEFPLF